MMFWGRRSPAFGVDADLITSPLPKVLWIELTSKCPFDCVFCTRKTRFGAGRHLDFDIYQSLIAELESPEFIGLNYSGESIYYPQLIEAITLARSTGASTELVTALAPIPKELLEALVASGLDRLAVSLHTMDSRQYREIYGFSSLELLEERIADFFEIKRKLGVDRPRLDFCFVAIHENLAQLAEVARYADQTGAAEVFVHPVIGRHAFAHRFPRELSENGLREGFKEDLRRAVTAARRAAPDIPITVLNPDLDPRPKLSLEPVYFAAPLPAGARIHTCDQSPFESVHVLATGDIVVCEIHDERSIGSLMHQSLKAIWQNEKYRQFRRDYVNGAIPQCRECVWKMAYLPGAWRSVITAVHGRNPQLLRGWYSGDRETVLWSKRESLLALRCSGRDKNVRIAGMLPHAAQAKTNKLEIACNGHLLGSILNPGRTELHFDQTYPLPVGACLLIVEFRVACTFRPILWGINSDTRDLGFALERIEARP